MGAACCHDDHDHAPNGPGEGARRILWIALAINATMFGVEIVAGLAAGSSALQADALDFLADAANYAISLSVLGLGLAWRAQAARVKAATMAGLGFWVIGSAIWYAARGTIPQAHVMGVVGSAALLANIVVAVMLFRFRSAESNLRSVWICSRNDVIGNIAVLLAALGVFGTGAGWPDIMVALIMAALALRGAWQILRQAGGEIRDGALAEHARG